MYRPAGEAERKKSLDRKIGERKAGPKESRTDTLGLNRQKRKNDRDFVSVKGGGKKRGLISRARIEERKRGFSSSCGPEKRKGEEPPHPTFCRGEKGWAIS